MSTPDDPHRVPEVASATPAAGADGIGRRGLGPFVTEMVVHGPDGVVRTFESRFLRKHARNAAESTWWAPRAIGWWIAVLFAIGSTCFALGALPIYTDAVGSSTDNLTYFIGSIFFTTAGFLQYLEVARTTPAIDTAAGTITRRRALFAPGRIEWWAAVIQLAGTLFFNLSTGHAAFRALNASATVNQAIWRPDALGSICFLISSYLLWAEVCHGPWRFLPRSISWWIVALNLMGSIAFGVSAIASKVTSSGDLRSLALTNLGTFVGAIGFLVGAILLLPERTAGDGAATNSDAALPT